jgi:hypothetical protein
MRIACLCQLIKWFSTDLSFEQLMDECGDYRQPTTYTPASIHWAHTRARQYDSLGSDCNSSVALFTASVRRYGRLALTLSGVSAHVVACNAMRVLHRTVVRTVEDLDLPEQPYYESHYTVCFFGNFL